MDTGAEHRAKEAAALAGTVNDPDCGSAVQEGSYVAVFISGVPASAAEAVGDRVQSSLEVRSTFRV